MYFKSACFALICLFVAACSRKPVDPAIERMAVLRFENLGPDASTDWMGRAFSEIIGSELSASPNLNLIPSTRLHALGNGLGVRPASAPGISAERPLALAAGATRAVYGDYTARPGRVDAKVTIEDLTSGKMLRVLSTSAPDVLTAATNLASQISKQVQPYPTHNLAAIQAYSTALEMSYPPAAIPQLRQAIAADPNFGAAYELLAQFQTQQQDRAGAKAVLQSALDRGNAVPAADRARIQFSLANLQGDTAGKTQSLTALTLANPRDPAVWQALADSLMAARSYPKSIAAYQKTLELAPDNITAWNQLGYASAYAGNLPEAMNALRRYQSLRPADSNPIDSMGDVNLVAGHFREAEGFYLEAAKKSPGSLKDADLFKAAMARLMSGDISGADAIASQYVKARAAAHDPQQPLLQPEWLWLSGRRKQACQQIEQVAQNAQPPLSIQAYNQLALWSLLLGDHSAAERSAAKVQPPAAAAIPRFLMQPPAPPEEWAKRGAQLIPNPAAAALRDSTVSAALLLARQFAAAAALLKPLYYNPAASSDSGIAVEYAWALLESGQGGEAAPLLRWNPLPGEGGPNPLISLYFPRVYFLRAEVAAKAGRTDEARANYRLFLQLSGPDPLLWGEEQKAKAALQ